MKILLTGASSYVGARLYLDLSRSYTVIGTYNQSKLSKDFIMLDVTNKEDVNALIGKQRPDLIVHAAANANARWCDANPEAAILLNERSTEYIVDAANKVGAKLIYISSFAAINAVNVYSKTKHNSEELVKRTKAGWAILRPSLILGFSPNKVNDRPFNRLLKNLDEKSPAVYDTSWKFQVTWVGHISEIIREIIKQNLFGEIVPIATEELKSRYDTAKDILSPFNIRVLPVDKKDPLPSIKEDIGQLKRLKLPYYSYNQIIEKIVNEIKNRKQFVL